MIPKDETTIPVVIVESHQHVLEHVHDVLRKKKLFDQPWSMVHFDAHPDLACTKSAPAIACFAPRQYYGMGNRNNKEPGDNATGNDLDGEADGEEERNLYELLDLTPSGIAEWIMPLVLAANLNRIEWIKPFFSKQIAEGFYRFEVGAEYQRNNNVDGNVDDGGTGGDDSSHRDEINSFLDLPRDAKLKVNFDHPYYLDDLSVVPSEDLVLKQTLELKVSELQRRLPIEQQNDTSVFCGSDKSGTRSSTNGSATKDDPRLWILDICLDYFACQNPFLSDLETKNESATRAFLDVMEGSIFNHCTDEDKDGNSVVEISNNQPATNASFDYQTELVCFHKLLKDLLLDLCGQECAERQHQETQHSKSGNSLVFDQISKYFGGKERAKVLIGTLVDEINANDDGRDETRLLSMIVDAIPNYGMPHEQYGEAIAAEKIGESLSLVEEHIQRHVQASRDLERRPLLVTIARSTLDGFCPPGVVEGLQTSVLDLLHRQICGSKCESFSERSGAASDCDRCRLRLLRDYGEWEGSTLY